MMLNHEDLVIFTTEELISAIRYHVEIKQKMTDPSFDYQKKWNDKVIESIKAELKYRAE